MFKPIEGFGINQLKAEADRTQKNFVIQKNDRLTIDIYSNSGEKLIDPNPELSQSGNLQNTQVRPNNDFMVDVTGSIKLPLIGAFQLEGLTIRQAEDMLQKEYAKYFKDPFIKLNYINKRAVILGATGGQVIPLTNENITLVEMLALAKGLDNNAKANNIRLLRGEQVFQVDFSTIQGYKEGNMIIQHGDIVYVEPIRRPFSEGLRDNAGVFSLVVSLATLITIISNINN